MFRRLEEVSSMSGSEALSVIGWFICLLLGLSTAYLYWRVYFKAKRGTRFIRKDRKYKVDEENGLMNSQA